MEGSTGATSRAPKRAAQRQRVLVAEAEPDAAFILAAWLERHGYQVALAGTANDATRCAAQSRIDVAFLSETLPDMSSQELAQRLRAQARHAHLRIIATGSDPRTRDDGIDTLLLLPLTAQALQEALRDQ